MPHNLYRAEDADRGILAVKALLTVLTTDPRIVDAYTSWRTRNLDFIEQSLNRHPEQPPGRGVVKGAIAAATYCDVSGDLQRLEQLVNGMGMPYPWLAEHLLFQFRVAFLNEARAGLAMSFAKPAIDATRIPGETQEMYLRRLKAQDAPPVGRRRAKGGGAHIRRNVEWYYRAEIKRPRDTRRELALDYAHEAGCSTSHSVVHDGIALAKQILSSVKTSPFSLPE